MLTITIPHLEVFDDETSTFLSTPEVKLELEHSLVSLSKWESEFEKPFLNSEQKTTEETLAYIKAMVITPNVSDDVFKRLTNENMDDINKYISAKMSATWFSERPGTKGGARPREVITAEIIYYWMTAYNIPLEWENRHLNRLMTLIKVCNEKNAPADKKPKATSRETLSDRARLNAQRKAQMGTKG